MTPENDFRGRISHAVSELYVVPDGDKRIKNIEAKLLYGLGLSQVSANADMKLKCEVCLDKTLKF